MRRKKQLAVCLTCAANGFTPRDVTPYSCAECGERGHLKFTRQGLDNYKRRGPKTHLVCTDCSKRCAEIESRLQITKALRCTCRGQQHSYANEKCKLYGGGAKRWPGCNLTGKDAVPQEDWEFVERLRKYRKR